MKTCAKCKATKPLVEFYNSKRFRDGLRTECKVCDRGRAMTWKKLNLDRARSSTAKWRARNSAHILEYGRRYYADNAELIKPKARAKAKTRDPVKVRETNKRSYYKNIEKRRAEAREWARANAQRNRDRARVWRKQNRERYLANVKAYEAAHPELRRMRTRLRRAGLTKAAVKWADRASIREIYRQARELTKLTGIPHHVDHVIPLAGKNVCGLHVETNLRIVLGVENIAKSNRLLEAA